MNTRKDCQYFKEEDTLRPCQIGRLAPIDCPTCPAYQPFPFIWDEEAWNFDEPDEEV